MAGECRRYESAEVDSKKGKPAKTFVWRKRNGSGGWTYRMPSPCPLYRLPELAAARAAGAGAPVEVWLVEGEKNADALAAVGVVAVSAPNGAHQGWREEFSTDLAGTAVVIVADRDPQGEARAESVRAALTGVAASVRVVRTPVDSPGADASDHLESGLALDAFEGVAAAAPVVVPSGAEGAGVAVEAARVVQFPGSPEPDLGGRGGSGGGGRSGTRIVRAEYAQTGEDGGAVVKVQMTKSGERSLLELLNAQVRITRRLVVDPGDGSPARVGYVDLVAERDGEVIELPRVPWDEFRKATWLDRLPWSLTWCDTSRGRSDLANAITRTSGPVPVVTSYGSLGWREIGDRWVYVHGGGGIDAHGSVPGIEVDVASRLSGFVLPAPPAPGAELASALRGVLEVLEVLPARIAAPAMGAALRAALGEVRCSAFVLGHTGVRKSGVAALAQQVFMPGARHNKLPVGAGEAGSTAAGLEELLWQAGDTLLVADDLAPDRGAERSAARANELLRMAGNGVPKLRGARSGGLRADRPPRGLLMLTGEDGGSRPSSESRTTYIPVDSGDVPLDVIKGLSTRDRIAARSACGAALVRYLASRMPVAEWVEDSAAELSAQLLAEMSPAAAADEFASRRADGVAELAVGWRALLDAGVDGGAFDEDAAASIWSRVWTGLRECLELQSEVTSRRGLVARSADLLRSAIRAGRAHLASEAGVAPGHDRLGSCGWRKDSGAFGDLRPGGDAVGWVTDDRRYVWLDPGAAFAAIERQGRAESDPLAVTQRALTKALVGAGVLTRESAQGRASPVPQVRRRAAGQRQRVWEVPWSWLWPDEGDDPTPPSSGDAPPPSAPTLLPAGPQPVLRERELAPSVAPREPAPAVHRRCTDQGEGKVQGSSLPQPESKPCRRTEYRSVGVVLDVDQAIWIGGDSFEAPELDSLADLATWAQGLNLGVSHERSRDDAGQVWIMPALARRLDLVECPRAESSRATSTHPAVKSLVAADWKLGRRGLQAWTKIWRDKGLSLHLVIIPWLGEDAICSPTNPPSVEVLAARLDLYSAVVRTPKGEPQPWLFSAGTTGTTLLRTCRATAVARDLTVREQPPPAVEDGGRRWEQDWAWQRGPTEEERRKPFVVAWDCAGQYLAAAAGVSLGLGEPRQLTNVPGLSGDLGTLTAPARSPRGIPPGFWRVPRTGSSSFLLPDLCDPAGRESDTEHVWITTPTLIVARQHGMDLRPNDAWVWDQETSWLQTWSHALRDARYTIYSALEANPNDTEWEIVKRAVKLTYAAGIGMLGSELRRGSEHYRPDARQHVIALAKANLFRKMAKAAAAGSAPLAVHRDCVLVASDTDDSDQEAPSGFMRGEKLGQVSFEGAVPMESIADALAASTVPSEETFGLFD